MLSRIANFLNKLFYVKNNDDIENLSQCTTTLKDKNGNTVDLPECDIKDAKPEEIKK